MALRPWTGQGKESRSGQGKGTRKQRWTSCAGMELSHRREAGDACPECSLGCQRQAAPEDESLRPTILGVGRSVGHVAHRNS